MTKEHLKKFRSALIRAVNKHIKNGGELIIGSFGYNNTRMCPIGCLTGTPTFNFTYEMLLSKKMGFKVSNKDMWSFIGGFDNLWPGATVQPSNDDMFALGQEMREKYLKEIVP
jgi:hypothetical protein